MRSPSISSSPGSSSHHYAMDSRHAIDPNINAEEYAYNKVFVGGLHYDTRDGKGALTTCSLVFIIMMTCLLLFCVGIAEFRSYFERYGKVISAEVMFNRETHKSRGFGFIVFEKEIGAERVCADKEHIISDKVVEVKRAIPRSKIAMTGNSLPSKLDSSGGSPPSSSSRAMRRRTMSTGSAQLSASSMVLSGNSSTLTLTSTAATASVSVSKKVFHGTAGGSPLPPRPNTNSGASYAAALLMGSGAVPTPSMSLALSSLDQEYVQEYVQASFDSPSSSIDLVRPSRAWSEPIAKYEGSSALHGELLPLDQALDQAHSRAGIIQPSSSLLSCSSSIAVQSSSPFSPNASHQLPWLSSPSTAPFDDAGDDVPTALQLPPVMEDSTKKASPSSGGFYGSSGSAGGAISFASYHPLQYSSTLQRASQRATSEQDDLFFSSTRSEMSSVAGRGRASSLGALGSAGAAVPSPDAWAAMFAGSQLSGGLLSLRADTSSRTWRFGQSSSLFGDASNVPDEAGGGGGMSRILGIAQASSSKELASSSYSELRLDSAEFDPAAPYKWMSAANRQQS
jgi:hypothetical protein